MWLSEQNRRKWNLAVSRHWLKFSSFCLHHRGFRKVKLVLSGVLAACVAYVISLVGNVWRSRADILVLGSQRTQLITGSAFRISFQYDWPIDNGIFNRPIMSRTQIQVHRWGPRTRVLALFHRRTWQKFSFVCANYWLFAVSWEKYILRLST